MLKAILVILSLGVSLQAHALFGDESGLKLSKKIEYIEVRDNERISTKVSYVKAGNYGPVGLGPSIGFGDGYAKIRFLAGFVTETTKPDFANYISFLGHLSEQSVVGIAVSNPKSLMYVDYSAVCIKLKIDDYKSETDKTVVEKIVYVKGTSLSAKLDVYVRPVVSDCQF